MCSQAIARCVVGMEEDMVVAVTAAAAVVEVLVIDIARARAREREPVWQQATALSRTCWRYVDGW